MVNSLFSAIGSITAATLIAVATRWLFGAKGAALPIVRDGNSLYGVMWQWRTLCLVNGVFWIALLIWSWRDQHSRPDWVLIAMAVPFLMAGLWLASGSITTNRTGITKTCLGHSRALLWKDITEIRLYKKRGRAIELRASAGKIVIDSRFNAFHHLLNEIEDHTQLTPIEAS